MEITSKSLGVLWRYLPSQGKYEVAYLTSGHVSASGDCANLAHFVLIANAMMCDMLQGECHFSPDIMTAIEVFEGKQTTLAGLVKRQV